jgi:ABC-type methionine transport system permease subunit
MGRSLPFLVLMAAIIPFTYWLTGEALNSTTPTSPPSVTTNSITMATISQVSP